MNPPTTMTPRIPITTLNTTFTRLTGYAQPLNWHAEYVWSQWLMYSDPEWTVTDLELVIAYVKRKMRKTPDAVGYTPGSLRFSRLIQEPQTFLELLGMAKAEIRKRDPNPARTEILRATGRTNPEQEPQSAGVVLERSKLAGMLGEWRKSNGF